MILIFVDMFFSDSTSNLKMHQCRLFDNQVYGVVHGLLMGHRENLWPQAQSLFIKVKEMDGSNASSFDLWHFTQVYITQIL